MNKDTRQIYESYLLIESFQVGDIVRFKAKYDYKSREIPENKYTVYNVIHNSFGRQGRDIIQVRGGDGSEHTIMPYELEYYLPGIPPKHRSSASDILDI